MTIYEIQQIHKYRIDLLHGCMKDWKDWAFEFFQREKHYTRWCFGPQHVGLFVRCFKCEFCCVCNGKKCYVLYHKHLNCFWLYPITPIYFSNRSRSERAIGAELVVGAERAVGAE